MLSDFYLEPVSHITVHYLYTSPSNEVESYTMDSMTLDKVVDGNSSQINPAQLVKTLEARHYKDGFKYKLQSLLRFVIDLAPEEISDFAQSEVLIRSDSERHKDLASKYLQRVNYLDVITYPAVINIFTDLSALYVIFKRKRVIKQTKASDIETNAKDLTTELVELCIQQQQQEQLTRRIKLHKSLTTKKTKKHKLNVEKA